MEHFEIICLGENEGKKESIHLLVDGVTHGDAENIVMEHYPDYSIEKVMKRKYTIVTNPDCEAFFLVKGDFTDLEGRIHHGKSLVQANSIVDAVSKSEYDVVTSVTLTRIEEYYDTPHGAETAE